jgi:hypothetical protein
MIYRSVRLTNPGTGDVVDCEAMVDTTTPFLCIPPDMAYGQLGFVPQVLPLRTVRQGSKVTVEPMASPVRIALDGLYCDVSALVMEGAPRLGIAPMAQLDIQITPTTMQAEPTGQACLLHRVEAKTRAVKVTQTVCYDCDYFFNFEPDSPREDIWYNHLCMNAPHTVDVDPQTGMPTYRDERYHVTDRPYRYCRDFNSGDCSSFVRRSTVADVD